MDGELRKIFRAKLPRAHWTSIESGGTAAGIPDSEYCFPGGLQGWVEFKRCSANAVRVRPEQVSWIERRVRVGGRVFVATRRGQELHVHHGSAVRDLRVGGLRAAAHGLLGSWEGGPAGWDWSAMEAILQA